MKEKILDYIKKTYNPTTIFLYGSYYNKTYNENSDFDSLIIVDKKDKDHDDSIIEGVELDLFIYTKNEIDRLPREVFTTLKDSSIICDDGFGEKLKNRVVEYVRKNSTRSEQQKEFIRSYIKKMCKRIEKDDLEGKFRAVALLNESLEDYYIFHNIFYFGPKKAIKYIKENDPVGYEILSDALTHTYSKTVIRWAKYIIGEK